MDYRQIIESYHRLRPEDRPLSCGAVVLGAGSAHRMGFDKMTPMLDGQPVLVRAVNAFEQSPLVSEIVVVTRADRIEEIASLCAQYNLSKVSAVVCGGKTRTESALAGVMALKTDVQLTAVHDGARPLLSGALIEACIRRASRQFAVIPVLRSTDTLRSVDEKGALNGTYDRDRVVRVQTPQVFLTALLKAALTDACEKGLSLTDDAAAIERLGMTVQSVPGEEENIKLTTPADLTLARGILEQRGGKEPGQP